MPDSAIESAAKDLYRGLPGEAKRHISGCGPCVKDTHIVLVCYDTSALEGLVPTEHQGFPVVCHQAGEHT